MSKKTKVDTKFKVEGKLLKAKLERNSQSTTPESDDSESQFDFGGLPRRDLKKNLGCG